MHFCIPLTQSSLTNRVCSCRVVAIAGEPSYFLVKGERFTTLQSDHLSRSSLRKGLINNSTVVFDRRLPVSPFQMLTALPTPIHCTRSRWLAYCSNLKSLPSCSTIFSRFIIDHLKLHYPNPILFISLSSLFDHKIENKSNPSIVVSHLPHAQVEQSAPSGGRRWRRPRARRR